MSLLRLSSLLILASALTACTRPEGESVKLSISIPSKVSSFSAGTQSQQSIGTLTATPSPTPAPTEALVHVVVNITGGGLTSPVLLTRSLRDGASVANQTEFELEVSQGEGRLVQVLAVYEKAAGGMAFYYGDQSNVSMKAASVKLPMKVSDVGSTTPIVSGTVWGRYFTDATSGPTGELAIKYSPGSGKPSLIVEKSIIANGWFQALALTGAKLEYVTDAGLVLFGGPVSLDDAVFKPASGEGKVLRVSIPAHDRNENYSGGHDWRREEAQVLVMGWFGHSGAISGKAVCRPGTLSPLTRLGAASSQPASEARTPLTGILNASTFPTAAQLSDIVTPLTNYHVHGGDNSPLCVGPPAPVEYQDTLTFASTSIDGNGKDGASPFFGVYKNVGTTYRAPFNLSLVSGNIRVQSALLPGTFNLFDKFTVYKRVGPGFYNDSENVSCLAINAGEDGFTKVTETSTGLSTYDPATGALDLRVSYVPADVTGGMNLVVCGSLGNKLYSRGLLIRSDWFSSLASSAVALAVQAPVAVGDSVCTRGEVRTQSAGGTGFSYLDAATTATVSATGSITLYYDAICSSASSTLALPLAAGSNPNANFYFTASGAGSISATPSTALTAGSAPVSVVSPTEMAQLIADQPTVLFNAGASSCHRFKVYAKNLSGGAVSENGDGTMTVNGSGVGIFTDAACTTSFVPPLVTMAGGMITLYAKAVSPATAQLNLGFTSAQSIPFSLNLRVAAVPSTSATKILLSDVSANSDQALCHEFSVSYVNDLAAPVAMSKNLSFQFDGGANGIVPALYTDASCASPLAFGTTWSSPATNPFSIWAKFVNPDTAAGTVRLFANEMGVMDGISGSLASKSIGGRAQLNVTPASFASTIVGSTSTADLTLTNAGGTAVLFTGGTFAATTHFNFNGGSWPGTGGTCGMSLPPGATCTIRVSFNPSSATLYNMNLDLHYTRYPGDAPQSFVSPLSANGF